MPVAAGWSVNKKGKKYQKGRFVKTAEHHNYLKRCEKWASLHGEAFTQIRNEILKIAEDGRLNKERVSFRVDTYFAFEESRLWTVNNLPQQLDADNRLKPCRDALAKILKLDDKYFFSGFFEKISANQKEQECTILRISLQKARTLQNLKMEIKNERETAASRFHSEKVNQS